MKKFRKFVAVYYKIVHWSKDKEDGWCDACGRYKLHLIGKLDDQKLVLCPDCKRVTKYEQ